MFLDFLLIAIFGVFIYTVFIDTPERRSKQFHKKYQKQLKKQQKEFDKESIDRGLAPDDTYLL